MKVLVFSFIFLTLNLYASEGIGGSEGGPGSKIWNIDLPSKFTVDWPLVRIRQGRNVPLNHFCIRDEETLRTIKKYGGNLTFNRENSNFLGLSIANKEYQLADRYFDATGCYSSSDPKCDHVNAYIEKSVEVPVYYGSPRQERGGTESIMDFARRARLAEMVKVKIPNCQ